MRGRLQPEIHRAPAEDAEDGADLSFVDVRVVVGVVLIFAASLRADGPCSSTPTSGGHSIGLAESSSSSATTQGNNAGPDSPLSSFSATPTNRVLSFSPKSIDATASPATPILVQSTRKTTDAASSPKEQLREHQVQGDALPAASPSAPTKVPDHPEPTVAVAAAAVAAAEEAATTVTVSLTKSADLSPCSRLAREWERRRRATPSKKPRALLTPPPSLIEATPAGEEDESPHSAGGGPNVDTSQGQITGEGSSGASAEEAGLRPKDEAIHGGTEIGKGGVIAEAEAEEEADDTGRGTNKEELGTSPKALGVVRTGAGRRKLRPISDRDGNIDGGGNSPSSFANEIARFRLKPGRKVGKLDKSKVEGTFLKDYWDE